MDLSGMIPIWKQPWYERPFIWRPTSRKDECRRRISSRRFYRPSCRFTHKDDAAGDHRPQRFDCWGVLCGGTTTAATNIDTETTSDTASVSTSRTAILSQAEATKQEVVEALSKMTEEHATPSPPVNLAVRCHRSSNRGRSKDTYYRAAIDVAETNVKSAEEILMVDSFDSMKERGGGCLSTDATSRRRTRYVAVAIENRNQ
jgi:hypothetical protein